MTIILVVAAVRLLDDTIPVSQSAYVILGFFVVGALAGWQLVLRPTSLTINSDGLAFRHAFRTTRYRWEDFSTFEIESGNPETVVGILAEGNAQGRFAGEGVPLQGLYWELNADEFLALLTAARARWGGVQHPQPVA